MMENWQFFLQKEGDYAWLPLETPQVEILEGRYQLIAHTANAGQSVQVKIRHQYEQENVPQENIQESIRQIGLSGKVDILPLIYLGLGSWSISCHPELQADISGSSDTASVQSYDLEIQVLSQDFDLFDDWTFSELDSQEDNINSEKTIETALNTKTTETVPVRLAEPIVSPAIAESHQSPSPISHTQESTPLHLPDFSTQTVVPSRAFRTVSPKELPRPVSDRQLPTPPQSPQLPVFSKAKAVVATQQIQRHRSLSKIQLIAAAVSQRHGPEISPSTRQEKFHSKLNRIAVGEKRPKS